MPLEFQPNGGVFEVLGALLIGGIPAPYSPLTLTVTVGIPETLPPIEVHLVVDRAKLCMEKYIYRLSICITIDLMPKTLKAILQAHVCN